MTQMKKTKTVVARPASLIARKAAGRMIVKTGVRAGASENAEKRR
jgi:hypothetical protein